MFKQKGLSDLLSYELVAKVKTIMTGTRAAGIAISRRIVMTIGNEVVKSNNPILLKEYGGSLQLTEDWARRVFNFGVLKTFEP